MTANINMIDAATFVRLSANEPDEATDILEGMNQPELIELAKKLAALTGLARTFRTGTAEQPRLTLEDWCTAVIDKERSPQPEPARPRRRTNRMNRIHLRESFEAGPYGSSDPFGYGPEDDD